LEQGLHGEALGLVLDPLAGQGLTDCVRTAANPTGRIALLVGPESGLAPHEIVAATRAGFRAVRLGPRILRTETAGLASIALLNGIWGGM
ncbi:RsmE family RNA methyltransferase, partial [Undibacterium luofuense]|uniref:RsmE family RNA methyltransferase n=1 Tax=Undibacterium luofuense TaxID=2828733 RepID=UPI0030EED738